MPTVNLYEILQRPLTIAEVDDNFKIVQTAVDAQPATIAAAVSTAADKLATAADRIATATDKATAENAAVAATAAAISCGTLANMIQQTNRITTDITIPDGVNALMIGPFEVSPDVKVKGLGTSNWKGI
jgi:hypothetical protein